MMTPEKDAQLRARYPLVFQTRLANDEPIRCSDGWFGLLDMLFAQLQRLIAAEHPDTIHVYTAFQVKEKFGKLRLYMAGAPTGRMRGEIDAAETLSGTICDVCGSLCGSLGTHKGVMAARCAEHAGKSWRELDGVGG